MQRSTDYGVIGNNSERLSSHTGIDVFFIEKMLKAMSSLPGNLDLR